jgi:hypothetical protein
MPVRSPENSTKYFALLIARVQILFTFSSVPFVASNTMLAHRKKCIFCKVTPVSIQAFVEGLLRLANVLEATNGTLENVNNICTLAINSAKYFVDFHRMNILIIEQNSLWSDFQRGNREIFWIKELRVLHPDGINRKQEICMYIFFHSVCSYRIFLTKFSIKK